MPSLRKTCECCGRITMNTRFCTRSCFVKWRRGKPFPTIRGGNGSGPTKPQAMLWKALTDGWWTMEYIVGLTPKRLGYPTHYKLDLAHPIQKIAIEIDGGKHNTLRQQALDRKKDEKLRELGWRVLRLKNKQVLSMSSTLGGLEELPFYCRKKLHVAVQIAKHQEPVEREFAPGASSYDVMSTQLPHCVVRHPCRRKPDRHGRRCRLVRAHEVFEGEKLVGLQLQRG